MPKIVECVVYTVDELTEDAREKAFNSYCENVGYVWGTDNEKTLDEFAKVFSLKIIDWNYGNNTNYIRWGYEGPYDEAPELEFTGVRLLKYLYNNFYNDITSGKYYSSFKGVSRKSKVLMDRDCELTGYYLDTEMLAPIYNFMDDMRKYPNKTFRNLLQEALDNWLKYCSKDIDNHYSMEYFMKEANDNDWEYFSDGTMF